jgi:hypothetical protein
MAKEFIQKRGFNYRKFTLYPDKLIIKTRTTSKVQQFELELDKIGYNKVYEADNVIWGKVIAIITTVIPLIFIAAKLLGAEIGASSIVLVAMPCWGLTLLNYLKEHQDDIILTGNYTTINFYRNKPSEEEVLSFIDEVIATSKQYIKKKYLRFEDYTTEEDFYNNLILMRAQKVISTSEYNLLKEEFKRNSLLK